MYGYAHCIIRRCALDVVGRNVRASVETGGLLEVTDFSSIGILPTTTSILDIVSSRYVVYSENLNIIFRDLL